MCYEIEMEDDGRDLCVSLSSPRSSPASRDEDIAAIADDPVADSEWTENYEKEIEADQALERQLKERLDGKVEITEW